MYHEFIGPHQANPFNRVAYCKGIMCMIIIAWVVTIGNARKGISGCMDSRDLPDLLQSCIC